MSTDKSITVSAIKFVSGESVQVCRLCLVSTDGEELCLDKCMKLQKPYFHGTVSFVDMFDDLGVSIEPQLPQTLCASCANSTINSFLFNKLCQYSNEKWEAAFKKLEEGLSLMDCIKDNVQTAFVMLNKADNIILTSKRTYTVKSKANVLNKMKNIMNNRIKSKHKLKSTICKECGVRCKTKDLHSHVKSHSNTDNDKLPCPQCAKYFTTKIQLKEHLERVHYPKVVQCQQCAKMFGTERMLTRHIKIHHTAAICKLCFVQFPSKNAMRAHLNKHDVNKCPRCTKNFLNKQSYKLHLKICGVPNTKLPQFFCDICNKGYARKNGLRTHLKTDHGFGRVHTCSWCNKKYDAISVLKNHIVKHTKERNFYCTLCGGKFVTRAALVYHTRLHTGERPFPCDMCDESFLSASRRMEHKRRKHFEPTKECPICHVKFVTRHQLTKHVERHYNPHSKLYVPEGQSVTEEPAADILLNLS